MVGSWQTSRIGTGNNFTSRMNTENDVVRTEAMTLRVWRARIESVVFGKDDARQVTAMFSTEQEAQALTAQLMQFARSQSVLVAPFSGEDEKRIAALNAGERAMDAGAPPARRRRRSCAAICTSRKSTPSLGSSAAGTGARRDAAQALLLGLRHRSAGRARSSAPTARRPCRRSREHHRPEVVMRTQVAIIGAGPAGLLLARAARQGRHRDRHRRAALAATTCSAGSAPACSSR